jgi:hypothetical protein
MEQLRINSTLMYVYVFLYGQYPESEESRLFRCFNEKIVDALQFV